MAMDLLRFNTGKQTKTDVEETKFTISAPDVIQLERKGKQYIMSVAHFGEPFVTQEIADVDLGTMFMLGYLSAHIIKMLLKKYRSIM